MSKKIAILGKLFTKYSAPFDDPSWEIWSMNLHEDANMLPRVDKWFDIHKNPANKNADVLLKDFPVDECVKLIGGKYYKTTAAWLIAYAILQGATDIALYGMKFWADHERRRNELENVRQMIFFAKGRGINITAPEDEEELFPEIEEREGKDFDEL